MLWRMPGGLLVRVLGPVEIGAGDDPLPVRRLLERGLVVRLALARGVVVSDQRLAADLWDDGSDGSDGSDALIARLRVVVSRLRRTLGPAGGAVVRSAGGYRIAADVVDLRAAGGAADRVRTALRASDHDAVRRATVEALGAWRGSALSDLRALPFARSEGERLDAWRSELTTQRLAAEVALGAGGELVGELTELAARDPLHEPVRGMLAVALYRAGRQADALAEVAALRRALADELGVDPTADTVALELRLLRQDPDLRPPTPAPAPPPPDTPSTTDIRPALARGLVGRRTELVALAHHLDDALAGRPAVVLVEGGPGSGRTRLLEALAHLGEQHGTTVCWGRSTAVGGTPAFWPWRQALRRWKQRTPSETVASVLTRTGGAIRRIVPELAPEIDAAPPAGPVAAALDPDDRFGVFEHVVAFLDAASALPGPGLVLLLDDLHLADLASLLLLAHVARSGIASRLLIAASLRAGELGHDAAEARAEVIRQPASGTIELTGLGPAAVAEQLALVLGRECDPQVAADVARRTGGNPLFVREIGRATGAGDDGMPAAIRDAVRRRIDALPAAAREVLSAAAVLGGEVEADLVAAALGAPVLEVLDALDEAATAGFLEAEHPHGYRFAHDIVRDAVGLDLGGGRRARLHLRAAEHLESVGAVEHRVAHHRLEALPLGDRERAVHAATAAADLALRQFAFEDAVGLYDRAIAAASASDAGRGELLVGKARAQHLSHDVAGAMQTCEAAAALAEHLDDPGLLGRAALVLHDVGDAAWLSTTSRWCRTALAGLPPGDGPVRAQLMAQLAVASVWDDDRISADHAVTVDATGSAALAMADRLGDPAATYTALRARQLARSGPEGTHERLGLGGRMLGLVHDVGDPAELWGRLWRFDALVQLGHVDEADEELDLLEQVVGRMRQPLPHWHLVRSRAALLSARGRFAEARVAADEAVQVALRGRHRSAEYPAHALRLSIGLLTGDPVDPVVFEVERYQPPPRLLSMMAAEWHATHGDVQEARRIRARLPRPEDVALKPFMHVLFHATSGSLAAALGDRSAADHAYTRLLPHADLHVAAGAGVSASGGSVQRVLGVLAGALDRTDDAIDHLRAAVAANDASGLAPSLALAQRRLADQLRRRSLAGDVEEAATLAATASATFARLGMPSQDRPGTATVAGLERPVR